MSQLQWPIDKVYITQRFGERPEVYKIFGMKGHNGIDFRTRFIDSPLGHRFTLAAAEGVVAEVTNEGSKGYGLFVRINHPDGSQTIYGHLWKTYVRMGQHVLQGTRLALTDNSGFSSGSHLHFGYRPPQWNTPAIYNNGFKGYVDPIHLLPPLPQLLP